MLNNSFKYSLNVITKWKKLNINTSAFFLNYAISFQNYNPIRKQNKVVHQAWAYLALDRMEYLNTIYSLYI